NIQSISLGRSRSNIRSSGRSFGVSPGDPAAWHRYDVHPWPGAAPRPDQRRSDNRSRRQFDFEADPGQIDAWADAAARGWGTGAVLAAHAATMRDSGRYREWAARVERNTSSPRTVAAMLRWAARVDVRPLLGRVRAPTLVLYRAD